MIKFFKYLVVTLIALILCDIIIGGGIDFLYSKVYKGDSNITKINYCLDSHNDSIYILGSSRAHQHYVPSIMKDSLGMTVYNAGCNGESIIFHYILLCNLLENNQPKIIIYEIEPTDIYEYLDPLVGLNNISYLFSKNSLSDKAFFENHNYWFYYSSLYRNNGKLTQIINGLFTEVKHLDGYNPIYGNNVKELTVIDENRKVDTLKWKYIIKFVDLCYEKNVKLIFVVSPKYSKDIHDPFYELKRYSISKGIPFIDFYKEGLFLDHKEYFKDMFHMNNIGAERYTTIFSNELRKNIKKGIPTSQIQ